MGAAKLPFGKAGKVLVCADMEEWLTVNRSRFEIMADILQACCLPRVKTRIMCKVKLNFTQANEYLTQLTSVGLLSKAGKKYATTEKGREFILVYNRLGEIMGIPDLSFTRMKVPPPLAHVKR